MSIISIGLLFIISLIFSFTSASLYLTIPSLFLWGLASFATVAPLQMNVVKAAHAAPNIASTINIGVFNIGNAIGAYLGGVPLSLDFSVRACIWVAVFLALLAVIACVLKAVLAKTVWKQFCQKSVQK
jgi:MFS transporter, DHA1 family, inner membrane transport protein